MIATCRQHAMNSATAFRAALLSGLTVVCIVSAAHAVAAKQPQWLLGRWVLNNELTSELGRVEKKGGWLDGFGRPSVSVGGLPVPLPGSSTLPATGSSRDPDVLRCATMSVQMDADAVHFSYTGVGEETMQPGNNQGRRTRWNKSRLTSRYETTSRKVIKTFELRKDGSLQVSVELNPSQGASVIHYRIFERPQNATNFR